MFQRLNKEMRHIIYKGAECELSKTVNSAMNTLVQFYNVSYAFILGIHQYNFIKLDALFNDKHIFSKNTAVHNYNETNLIHT